MINMDPHDLERVKQILAAQVPDCEVRAFGSRVKTAAKPYSDLDLAIVGSDALDPDRLCLLKEAFEESEISIRVDLLDWHALSANFQRVIERGYEVVQAQRSLDPKIQKSLVAWGEKQAP